MYFVLLAGKIDNGRQPRPPQVRDSQYSPTPHVRAAAQMRVRGELGRRSKISRFFGWKSFRSSTPDDNVRCCDNVAAADGLIGKLVSWELVSLVLRRFVTNIVRIVEKSCLLLMNVPIKDLDNTTIKIESRVHKVLHVLY